MQFSRSGGFAGKATAIDGTVTFSGEGGKVTSSNGDYSRTLRAEEVSTLQDAGLALMKGASSSKRSVTTASAQRDGYQYALEIVGDDGAVLHLDLSENNADTSAASSLDTWVQEECDRIWEERIAHRRP